MCKTTYSVFNCCKAHYSTHTRLCPIAEDIPEPERQKCEKSYACYYVMTQCEECKKIARLEEDLQQLLEADTEEEELRQLEREIKEEEEALSRLGKMNGDDGKRR